MKKKTLITVIIANVLLSVSLMSFDWHNEANKTVTKKITVPYKTENAPETPGACKMCGWSCLVCDWCGRMLPDFS